MIPEPAQLQGKIMEIQYSLSQGSARAGFHFKIFRVPEPGQKISEPGFPGRVEKYGRNFSEFFFSFFK